MSLTVPTMMRGGSSLLAHTAGDKNKGVAWFHYPPYTATFYTYSTRIGVTLGGPLVMLKKE